MGEGKGGGRGGVGWLKVVVVCSSQYRFLKGPMFCKMLWLILWENIWFFQFLEKTLHH